MAIASRERLQLEQEAIASRERKKLEERGVESAHRARAERGSKRRASDNGIVLPHPP